MNLMISVIGQYRNRLLVFLHDLAWVPVSLYLAFGLRFNLGGIPAENLSAMRWMLGLALPIFAGLYWYFGLYRGTWRFVSISDLIRLVKTVVMGVLATTLAVVILWRFEGVPRSVLILFPLLLAQGLAAPRLLYRWLSDKRITLAGQERQRALIVGAGRPGELLLRNIVRNGLYLPVGFVDPDPRMAGKEIHGVRVLGEVDDIPALVRRNPVDIVLLAIPDVDPDVLRKVLELCTELRLPCRTLPRRDPSGQIVVDENKLRPVRIEDLLSREPVTLNLPEISRHLAGRRVLVTGEAPSGRSSATRWRPASRSCWWCSTTASSTCTSSRASCAAATRSWISTACWAT
jgi:FlaA1/EpsC-like NDP-sugar epimerase